MVLLLIFSLYGAEHLMITWEDLLTSTLLKLVVKCIYSQLRLKNMFEVLFIYFFYYCFSASERYSRWGAEWLFRKVTPWNRSFQTAGSPARTEAAQTRIFTAQTKHGRSGMFCWRFALVVVGGGATSRRFVNLLSDSPVLHVNATCWNDRVSSSHLFITDFSGGGESLTLIPRRTCSF